MIPILQDIIYIVDIIHLSIERFINEDAPLGQTRKLLTHNILVYCSNNPINMDEIKVK